MSLECVVCRFEIQDVVRKSSKEELPDFYNIQLERPKDDPAGFDVLFIDAAAKVRAASLPDRNWAWNILSVPPLSDSYPFTRPF